MNVMELENAENSPSEEVPAEDAAVNAPNELNKRCWAVVSFEKCVAGNLTYEQATRKIAELAAEKISGLCIITDDAAARILSEPPA